MVDRRLSLGKGMVGEVEKVEEMLVTEVMKCR